MKKELLSEAVFKRPEFCLKSEEFHLCPLITKKKKKIRPTYSIFFNHVTRNKVFFSRPNSYF